MKIVVQTADFDVGAELRALASSHSRIGAVASFVGLVRDLNDGRSVSGMRLEHYPGMTEKALVRIVSEAQARWQVDDALVIHRVGPLQACDQIVLVAVASMHRQDAFAACAFIMDYLKTSAPFWKHEDTSAGPRWVAERATDLTALQRWEIPSTSPAAPQAGAAV